MAKSSTPRRPASRGRDGRPRSRSGPAGETKAVAPSGGRGEARGAYTGALGDQRDEQQRVHADRQPADVEGRATAPPGRAEEHTVGAARCHGRGQRGEGPLHVRFASSTAPSAAERSRSVDRSSRGKPRWCRPDGRPATRYEDGGDGASAPRCVVHMTCRRAVGARAGTVMSYGNSVDRREVSGPELVGDSQVIAEWSGWRGRGGGCGAGGAPEGRHGQPQVLRCCDVASRIRRGVTLGQSTRSGQPEAVAGERERGRLQSSRVDNAPG